MAIVFADPPKEMRMSRDDWEKARAYADKIASVGGSLLANATQLRKQLDKAQIIDDPRS